MAPISIGSNIASLVAGRRIDQVSDRLAKNFERLASGLRINRAVDDAAGLAISEKLQADARVITRGRLNIGDGVSALQIASSAVDQITGLLTRMAELSEQSANGTFTKTQRKSLDSEYQQLDLEIRRIISTSEFNGENLFAGEPTDTRFEQITNFTAGGSSAPLSLSGDGNLVTFFDSNSQEIKRYNETTGELSTLVKTTGFSVDALLSDSSGENIVFTSTADLVGENAINADQVYHLNIQTGEIVQVTAQPGAYSIDAIALSADGTTVVFETDVNYTNGQDKTGANGLTAEENLAVVNLQTYTYTTFSDIGARNGDIEELAISADGSKIALRSNKSFGYNGDSNDEIYVMNSDLSLSSFQQATNTTGAFGILPSSLSINNNGMVYFASSKDLGGISTGADTTGYRYDSNTQSISTFIPTNNGIANLSNMRVNSSGTRAIIATRDDIDGIDDGNNFHDIFEVDLISGELFRISRFSASAFFSGTIEMAPDGGAIYVSSDADPTGENPTAAMQLFRLDSSQERKKFDIEVGEGSAGGIITEISALRYSIRGLGNQTLSSQASARAALDSAQSNLAQVAQIQGVIGAGLSRLATANNVLSVRADQTLSANARIVDADIAVETASLTKNQILQQTAAAVLAQASQQPSLALQLLSP